MAGRKARVVYMNNIGGFMKIITIGCILGIALFLRVGSENNTNMKLTQETQLTTDSGCTFTVEKGWFVSRHSNVIVIEEPNRELTITLIENTEATAEQAVLAAWKQVQPDFNRTIKHKVEGNPQDGWDEVVSFIYDSSTNEEQLVMAMARRVGKTWYLDLWDGLKGAFDRRGAGVGLINSSFKVPGTQEESFANKEVHIFDAAQLKKLMTFVQDAQVQYKVPGVAIGIVQDGKLIFEQGFGVRAVGKKEKITPQTLFMIGSTTKSLTTFMMACLVDEGKFTWDTPVNQVMPDFALGDEATTKKLLMKHLVSASTGIPRQDMELFFNYNQATPELRVKEMKNMKPTTGFGETFQYSNSMVAAGGYVAAHSLYETMGLGKAYDTAMQSRVFDPLGMPSTTFDFAQVKKADHAVPHGMELDGTYTSLKVDDEIPVRSVRPAGGAWSNVHDMAQYMITELNKGITSNNKRVISENNLLKRRDPQIQISDKLSYGLGLMMENYHGILSVGHGGLTNGFSSDLFFLPEYKMGLVILTNARGAGLLTMAVKRRFMELFFDGKMQAEKEVKVNVEQNKKIIEKSLKDITFKPDSAWLKQFVGTYTEPALGQIVIREVDDGAELDTGEWKSALGQKKKKNGNLKLILTTLPFAGLTFTPEQGESTTRLVLRSGQHKYVFERN
jgi:CubicO group peptidase (beta-lactamase class C family)